MGEIPAFNASWSDIARYAQSFNAYERWHQDPEKLRQMLHPLIQEHEVHGRIPKQAGDDALRAWLFLLIRQEHFTDSISPEPDGSYAVTESRPNPIIRHIIIELDRRKREGRHS